jgi:hypothetical protein
VLEVIDCFAAAPVATIDLTPEIRPHGNTIWTKGGGMSRSKHTEAQIIAALKQVEAGRTADDVAREQGVSKYTIYAWKAKYGGMEVSEAEEVKHLREMGVARTSFRYESCRDDSDLCERLLALAREKPRYGYRRLHA